MKKPILLCAALVLSACQGWEPLYQQGSASNFQKISEITILPTDNAEEQHLYNALLDRQMNAVDSKKNYDLSFKLLQEQTNQATLSDDSSAIVRMRYHVDYVLDNGQQQKQFQSQTSITYAADDEPLYNETLAQQTTQQTMENLADMMIRRIASFFVGNPEW